jgi:hypothetical protein
VLDGVEFRNDRLRAFGEKEEATIGGPHQQLLAPGVQALRIEQSCAHKGGASAGIRGQKFERSNQEAKKNLNFVRKALIDGLKPHTRVNHSCARGQLGRKLFATESQSLQPLKSTRFISNDTRCI